MSDWYYNDNVMVIYSLEHIWIQPNQEKGKGEQRKAETGQWASKAITTKGEK